MAKRRRSPLLKLRSEDENTYEVTVEECKYWFGVLNKELFDRELTPLEIHIAWRRKAHAWYEYPNNRNTEDLSLKLLMNKRYKSKKFFVEVMAHELVHHYQFLNNEPIGHGPSFVRWEEKFNKKGLHLVRPYEE